MKTKTSIKTVIVGVDFSKYSNAVVQQARALSKHLSAPLVFVHVYEDPVFAKWNDKLVKRSLQDAHIKRVKARYGVATNEVVVIKCGTAFEEILAIAKNYPRPFIVVGGRGNRGAISRFFIGSTAERLALKSPYPVMVHKGRRIVVPKKILIPCDFSNRAGKVIDGIKKLKLKSANLELFHVRPVPVPILDYQEWQVYSDELDKINAQELKKFKRKFAAFKVVDVKSNDVVEKIEVRGKAFDLIAISPREHKGKFSSFGSVTSKVIRVGDTSVLVVP